MLLILVRHAKSSANAGNILAGRTEGIHLDQTGRDQAEELVERFANVKVSAIFGSPMTRCKETAEALCIQQRVPYEVDERLNEVDYGDWSGQSIDDLSKDPLWKVNQETPETVVFPGGESMEHVFARAKDFLDSFRSRPDEEIVLAFSNGDVIKAIVAAAYCIPLNEFQRVVVDPAGITVVRLSPERTFVVRVNDSATTLEKIMVNQVKDATVGGETS